MPLINVYIIHKIKDKSKTVRWNTVAWLMNISYRFFIGYWTKKTGLDFYPSPFFNLTCPTYDCCQNKLLIKQQILNSKNFYWNKWLWAMKYRCFSGPSTIMEMQCCAMFLSQLLNYIILAYFIPSLSFAFCPAKISLTPYCFVSTIVLRNSKVWPGKRVSLLRPVRMCEMATSGFRNVMSYIELV